MALSHLNLSIVVTGVIAMTDDRKPQAEDKYIIRFPNGMRDHLKEAAKVNNRTLNAEIVARLERSFTAEKEVERIAFESGFEAAMLREDVTRLTELLKKAEASKVNQMPSADDLAEKVAERLNHVILPFSHESLQEYLEIIERSSVERNRKWWQEQFGYDPEAPQIPQHGGPPIKSTNAKRPIKKI